MAGKTLFELSNINYGNTSWIYANHVIMMDTNIVKVLYNVLGALEYHVSVFKDESCDCCLTQTTIFTNANKTELFSSFGSRSSADLRWSDDGSDLVNQLWLILGLFKLLEPTHSCKASATMSTPAPLSYF